MFDSIYAGIRDTKDYGNHLGAAFTTGFLFKSTTGLRQAVTSGLLLTSVVGGFGLADNFLLKKD